MPTLFLFIRFLHGMIRDSLISQDWWNLEMQDAWKMKTNIRRNLRIWTSLLTHLLWRIHLVILKDINDMLFNPMIKSKITWWCQGKHVDVQLGFTTDRGARLRTEVGTQSYLNTYPKCEVLLSFLLQLPHSILSKCYED